jgi:hypothetical protein
MRHGILRFHRKHSRDFRNYGGQLIVHRINVTPNSASVTEFGGLEGLS